MSDALRAVLLPAAMWGMLSALLLELIELRSLFIEGGAARLRLSTLAFALGVVLIQRLEAEQGESAAGKYGIALGGAMLLFTIVETYSWTLPPGTFFVNIVLLGVLWWSGHHLTAACAMEDGAAAAAAERGIFSRNTTAVPPHGRREAAKTNALSTLGMSESEARIALFQQAVAQDDPAAEPPAEPAVAVQDIYRDFHLSQKSRRQARREEKQTEREKEKVLGGETGWSSRLGGRHPGRVLLWFALFALPVFGATSLTGGSAISPARSGIFLFVYLWCALTLLWLASLGQVSAYFRRRDATLPEVVAMNWIGLGLLVTTVAVMAAFFLPAPASASNEFVRDRLIARYRGLESKSGLRDTGPQGSRTMSASRGNSGEQTNENGESGKGIGEQGEGEAAEREHAEPAQSRTSQSGQPDPLFDSALENFFRGFLFVLVAALLLIAAIAIYAGAMFFLRSMASTLSRPRAPGKARGVGKAAAPAKPERGRSFASFSDPFAGGGSASDIQAILRQLWEATEAFCAERGWAPSPGTTPREFLASAPAPLGDFAAEARWLAETLDFSEFSGKAVPDAARPRLQAYWQGLKARSS